MLQRRLGSSTVGDHNPIQRFVRDIRVANTHGARCVWIRRPRSTAAAGSNVRRSRCSAPA